jgi:hypothetical protein
MARGRARDKIDKGHLLKDTDKLLARTTQYRKRLAELKGTDSLVDLATKQKIISSKDDLRHAEKEWLGGPNEPLAWWPNIEHKEAILREGFIRAYEIALRDPDDVRPIETFWIPGWSSFATVALAGPGKVTLLLILTPPPPPGKLTGTKNQNVFVVASDKTIAGILDTYANRDDAASNVSQTSTCGVEVFRVKGA